MGWSLSHLILIFLLTFVLFAKKEPLIARILVLAFLCELLMLGTTGFSIFRAFLFLALVGVMAFRRRRTQR